MIEHKTIDGKSATLAYLDGNFEPVDKDKAEIIKIILDDGETVFLGKKSNE